MNFNFCPHCLENGRPGMLERLNEWGLMISRSDGIDIHLILGDSAIAYHRQLLRGSKMRVSHSRVLGKPKNRRRSLRTVSVWWIAPKPHSGRIGEGHLAHGSLSPPYQLKTATMETKRRHARA
jgi:hypothetical protein